MMKRRPLLRINTATVRSAPAGQRPYYSCGLVLQGAWALFFVLFFAALVAASSLAGAEEASSPPAAGAAGGPGGPRLFFSDLTSGPNHGWEGSGARGAAVTVWGLGLGAERGSSYVTVNGARLLSDSDYAEWGAAGPARGLERITFWVSSRAAAGPGGITVTVGGRTSNALPFTVRPGRIYFIAPDGSNSRDGRRARRRGLRKGPWADFFMANFDSNRRLADGDIVYLRAGTYRSAESGGFAMHVRNRSCSAARPCAIVGYPGDAMPVVDSPGTEIYQEFSHGNRTDYWTVAKIRFRTGAQAMHTSGDGWRVVGCVFENYKADAHTGVIKPAASDNAKYLGLLFKDSGYDYYKHAIYPTCRSESSEDRPITHMEIGWIEIDNWIGDLGSGRHLGGAALNFRDNSLTNIISGVYIHDSYMHDSPSGQFFYNEEQADDIHIYNNVISGTNQEGVRSARYTLHLEAVGGVRRFYVYNNTFYNNSSGRGGTTVIAARGHASAKAVVYSSNNIYYNTDPSAPYFYNNRSGGSVIFSMNDLFYGAGRPEGFSRGKYFRYASAVIGEDPLFIDAGAGDFRLRDKSPAIDRGTAAGGLNGVVRSDFAGTPRPQGAGYDMGAYERVP